MVSEENISHMVTGRKYIQRAITISCFFPFVSGLDGWSPSRGVLGSVSAENNLLGIWNSETSFNVLPSVFSLACSAIFLRWVGDDTRCMRRECVDTNYVEILHNAQILLLRMFQYWDSDDSDDSPTFSIASRNCLYSWIFSFQIMSLDTRWGGACISTYKQCRCHV